MPGETAPVTVVIPTHNRSALLPRALASVEAQTRLPQQVIVVDDGSTDDTAWMLQQRFPDVVYLHQPQRGVSAARNHGIAAATAPWIALLDSDDAWLPSKLERQLDALRRQPELRVCHTDEIWIRNGRRVNPMRKHAKVGGRIFTRCLPLCAISPSSVLLHRNLLLEVGPFDPELPACEDYDLWLRICARDAVLLVDQPLIVKYGGHPDQLSRQYWGMDRFRIRALEKLLTAELLGDSDRRAALKMLLEKIDIYVMGAAKRGRAEEVAHYRAKRQRWQTPAP